MADFNGLRKGHRAAAAHAEVTFPHLPKIDIFSLKVLARSNIAQVCIFAVGAG